MTVEQILADYARDELYARLTGIWFCIRRRTA